MKYKFQYTDYAERDNILSTHLNMTLIEEQNLLNGNFLIFLDIPPNQEKVLTEQVSELKEQLITAQDAIDFLLMGGM